MRENVDANPEGTHPSDNTKAQEILRRVCGREKIRAIDLSKISKRVDQRKRDGACLLRHGTEGRGAVRQREPVGRPEPRGHEDKEHVPRREVVDETDNDSADEGQGEPAGNDEAADFGILVAEVAGC